MVTTEFNVEVDVDVDVMEILEYRVDDVEVLESPDLCGLILEDDMVDPAYLYGGQAADIVVPDYLKDIDLDVPELLIERLTVVQGGGTVVEVCIDNVVFWDNLPKYVSIDTNYSNRQVYSNIYGCTVPEAVVEIGPYCVAPIFAGCIDGVCQCKYILCKANCQLKPCRFAAAVLGFDGDVTCDDLYVLTSAYRGVCIVDSGCQSTYECNNYSTITGGEFKVEMDEKVSEELCDDKLRVVDRKPQCVHALGGVAKSNGKLRPVTDCSQPDLVNINEFMTTTCAKFRYKTVDTVVDIMHPYDWGAVSDIASAYRTLHILPSHRRYQGLKWEMSTGEVYLEDLRLCFGLRCAPFAFTQFSNFLVKSCAKLGVKRCVNYLDDFVVLGGSQEECEEAQEMLHRVLHNFGFVVADQKVTKPSQLFKYLGIYINTVNMTLSIGQDKLQRVKREVLELLDKKVCKRKDLEETAGLLAHCATVVKGGRTFARRIYNALRDARGQYVELDEVVQQDFIWWASFVTWFNGKACVLGADREDLYVFTDSSNYGFGAHLEDDYCWGVWTQRALDCPHSEDPPIYDIYDDHINITELWPVVVAIHRWGLRWRNGSVMVVTDNTQVQAWVNKGSCPNPYAMAWLRELFWVASFYNITIRACRIRSEDNILADALSRLNSEDSVIICEAHIDGFSGCCRATRAAG